MINKTSRQHKKQEISENHVPKRDNHLFEQEQYNPVKSEMALWTAVITQALMDAGSESRKPEAQHEKAKAIRWLLGNSEDFITVCQNAGLDPQSIRQKAISAIERGCTWRRGAAEKHHSQQKPRILPPLQKKYHAPVPLHPSSKFFPHPLPLSSSLFPLLSLKPTAEYAPNRH